MFAEYLFDMRCPAILNRILTISLPLGLCLIFTMCGERQEKWFILQGGAWNTTYTIKYKGTTELRDSIYGILNDIDQTFSPFNPSSLVSAINENGDHELTDDFIEVFEKSVEVCRMSKGGFDPTVEPLLDLWGFGAHSKNHLTYPAESEISAALELVGISCCSLDGKTMHKKNPCTRFNFSAIAKGYGCDKITEMLERNGARNYLVEIGGDLRMGGKNPHDSEWVVQIDAPTVNTGSMIHEEGICKIKVTGRGVATSGNYRNRNELDDGTLVWHTVNPVTGYPNITPVLSATVIAPTSMEADAYATAIMSMEFSEALKVFRDLPGIEVLLVLDRSIVDGRSEDGWKSVSSSAEYSVISTAGFPPQVD